MVREIIGQVVGVLCYSKKNTMDSLPKIHEHEFILENIVHKCPAYQTGYQKINRFYKKDDPVELKTVGNELLYQLEKKNIQGVFYWISWIINWEKNYTKRVGEYRCSLRTTRIVDAKFHRDVVWFFWEIVLSLASSNKIKNQINSLFKIYQVDFTRGKKNTRLPLILNAFQYLTEDINFSIPVMVDVNVLLQIGRNMSVVYGEIMENQPLSNNQQIQQQLQQQQQQQQQHYHPQRQQHHPQHQQHYQNQHSPQPYSNHAMSPEVNQELRGFYNTPIIQQQAPNSAIIENPFTSNNQQKIKPSKKKKKDDLSVESQQKLNLVDQLFNQMS